MKMVPSRSTSQRSSLSPTHKSEKPSSSTKKDRSNILLGLYRMLVLIAIVTLFTSATSYITLREITEKRSMKNENTKSDIKYAIKHPTRMLRHLNDEGWANNDAWQQVGENISPVVHDRGGCGWAVDISHDGKRIVIGCPFTNTYTGSAHVYLLKSGVWNQIMALSGQEAESRLGFSVSMPGGDKNIVAIGEPGYSAGRVHIFERNNAGFFAQMGNPIEGYIQGMQFGWVVDLSGDGKRIAIGQFDGYGFDVWDFDGSAWERYLGDDIFPVPNFMSDISLSNDGSKVGIGTFTIGAKGEPIWADANVYGLTDGDPLNSVLLKYEESDSVAISGNGQMVAIGIATYSCADCPKGVRVYDITSGTAIQVGEGIADTDDDDRCGISFDLSEDGRTIVIGCLSKVLIVTLNDDDPTAQSNWKIEKIIPLLSTNDEVIPVPSRRTVAISSDGGTVVVGEPDGGIVRVFTKSTSNNGQGKGKKKRGKGKKKRDKGKKKDKKSKKKSPKGKKGKGKKKGKKKIRTL